MNTLLLWFGFIAVIGVLWFVLRIHDANERQRALRHVQDRPSFSPKEFAHHYFSVEQQEIAEQITIIFAKHISIDTSHVHPDDKLVEELRMDALDSMSTVEFVIDLERHFKITISNSDAMQMHTLRDITQFVSHELQKKQSI
jgi:acyl carrier protein